MILSILFYFIFWLSMLQYKRNYRTSSHLEDKKKIKVIIYYFIGRKSKVIMNCLY